MQCIQQKNMPIPSAMIQASIAIQKASMVGDKPVLSCKAEDKNRSTNKLTFATNANAIIIKGLDGTETRVVFAIPKAKFSDSPNMNTSLLVN